MSLHTFEDENKGVASGSANITAQTNNSSASVTVFRGGKEQHLLLLSFFIILDICYFLKFTLLSFSDTVRLNIRCSGVESLSAVK